MICADLKFWKGSRKFWYSFRKDLPFTPVQPSPSAQLDDDEAQVDKDDG
jgi:hypothetical protein